MTTTVFHVSGDAGSSCSNPPCWCHSAQDSGNCSNCSLSPNLSKTSWCLLCKPFSKLLLQNWGNKHKESINSTEHCISSKALSNHPNRYRVNLLLTNWVQGFLTSVWWLLNVTHICKNTVSTERASNSRQATLKKGFQGLHGGSIRDLSAPHDSSILSVNSLISLEPVFLNYVSEDKAVQIIKLVGVGLWKADITDAFKVIPLHSVNGIFLALNSIQSFIPQLKWLLVAEAALAFFDSVRNALLDSLYYLQASLHLLSFRWFFGSQPLLTRLPKFCSKRDFLSLLGHLNFSVRIIFHGCSFVSCLLVVVNNIWRIWLLWTKAVIQICISGPCFTMNEKGFIL